MFHLEATVVSQRAVSADYREVFFSWPVVDDEPVPGQFFTLRAGLGPSPLLRRPFAFASFDPSERTASAIYEKRGAATAMLAAKRVGETLDILAPLGNSFRAPSAGRRPVLLAGGIGVGPMAFFAERLAESRPLIVVGARTVSLLPDLSLPADVELVTATDDGSRGHPGTVLDYLSDSERSGSLALNAETAVMYACGPWPMLGAAAQFAAERGIECFVSVEQTMGCAVGACMGCAVRVKGTEKFARVCTEGPIFRSERLVWT